MSSEITFETIIAQFAGDDEVAENKWFGKICLKVNGKAFVVAIGNDLAFKLTGEQHAAALQIEGAHLFDPRGKGKAFKEWVQVPSAQADSWADLARQAREFVAQE